MSKTTKILLIEDHPLSQKIFQKAIEDLNLEESQIDVRTALRAQDAIEIIQGGFRPHVVFLDWKLGPETGKDFLGWVRTEHFPRWVRYLSIYVLSSSSSKADLESALSAPMANAYFVKPAKIADLTEIVEISLRFGENTQQV